jgi:lipoic acid synthetase
VGPRLPAWLRKPETAFVALHEIKRELRRLELHTVCESARCPNIHECFRRGTATFMILGDRCTRGCGFCAVPKARHPAPPDPNEPAHVAQMARAMNLRHVVVTSVNRDDLPDGGAGHFAETIRAIRAALPAATIEVLTPDFLGDLEAVTTVLEARPDVFNHNVETVPRLYPRVRPQARYERSLAVLEFAARNGGTLVKSGLMVGLGERCEEVEEVLRDLRRCGVSIVTIGQYLQPTRRNLPVAEYVPPERFEAYRETGLRLGFRAVFSGPFVRSSYMAELVAHAALAGGGRA